MEDYIVTELAGKEVAGIRNPGEAEVVSLSRSQAEHAVRQGYLIKKDAPAAKEVPSPFEGRRRRKK